MFFVCVKLFIVAYLSCSVSVSCEKQSRICDASGGVFLQYASHGRTGGGGKGRVAVERVTSFFMRYLNSQHGGSF